ncbi:hypothetical protein LR48_Vigan02g122100 [Vigna angularis]|uniref:ABC transmembrane type-1 domain-containing protein n=1 Tax=Phaseolus angularis TaxID=3914 RepID=A0A0L9TX44_PHAAN|nr:hypothetical protein LR48_Vigan02g122100 [Vigna angularis]
MTVGSLAAVAHGTALIIYLHYFAKIIHVLRMDLKLGMSHEQFNRFTELETLSIKFTDQRGRRGD